MCGSYFCCGLQAVFDCFDKFEEEFQNGRGKAREKATKDKNPMTTLQSIHEDEGDARLSYLPPIYEVCKVLMSEQPYLLVLTCLQPLKVLNA